MPAEKYAPGLELTVQGSEPEHVYLIEQGIVKLTCAGLEGRGLIVGLKFPGELIAAQYATLREPCFETATTITRCSLTRWPIQEFLDKLARDSAFSFAVCRRLSRDTRELHSRLASLGLRSARRGGAGRQLQSR